MDLFALPVHPAAELFPLMKGDELEKLAADIQKNGLRSPIVIFDRMGERSILDGRNRLQACRMAGVEPEHRTWVGSDPIAYVTSVNMRRRHLVASQLALLAVNIAQLYDAEAKRRQKTGKAPDGAGGRAKRKETSFDASAEIEANKSRAKAAAQLGVSARLVQNAKKVMTKAAPEVTAAVQAGKVTVGDAVRVVDQPTDTQAVLVAKVEEGEARTLTEALRAMQPNTVDEEPAPESAPVLERVELEPPPASELEAVWRRAMRLSRAELGELHARLARFLEAAA